MNHKLTVITPTTGKANLDRLIASVQGQTCGFEIYHVLLWDNYRSPEAKSPELYNNANCISLIMPPGLGRNGKAPGSPLRAVGLMAAQSPWVTFADDDVVWDENHAQTLVQGCEVNQAHWGYSFRKIWTTTGEYIGKDLFESVGDEPSRNVPYEMVDNNCMIFKRELGVYAAHQYRLTQGYDDDRLMYQYLKSNAGVPFKSRECTINHQCPEFLLDFFRVNCLN